MPTQRAINPDRLSLRAIPITIKAPTGATLAVATAFFYRYKKKVYLVTNWHNFTGIHPDTRLRIDATSPSSITFPHRQIKETGVFTQTVELQLYTDEKPEWYIHPHLHEEVDVVVIEIDPLNETDTFLCINDIDFDTIPYKVADDVFILGFPLAIHGGHNFPIWKRGSIASEPEINIGQKPIIYIDSATRRGMSGSPVFARRDGIHNLNEDGTPKSDTLIGQIQMFVGVYSGRLIEGDDLLSAQLGIVWKAETIEQIINGKVKDTPYYPNENFAS
jgi:hypothetical protein